MGGSYKGDAVHAAQKSGETGLRHGAIRGYAQDLLEDQSAEAMGDERDVSVGEAVVCEQQGQQIVGAVDERHGVAAPERRRRGMCEAPNGEARNVVG
jgi:hypothetical protein